MEGTVSKDPADTLLLDLKQVELSYIFDILNIPVLQFAGRLPEPFQHYRPLRQSDAKHRSRSTKLLVQPSTIRTPQPFSEWDDQQKGILMLGSIYKNDTTWTDVSGYVYPVGKNAGLSSSSGHDLNLAFHHFRRKYR